MIDGDPELERAIDELEELEQRAAKVILRRPRTERAEQLAALMNWLIFGRWPGEVKRGDRVMPGQPIGRIRKP